MRFLTITLLCLMSQPCLAQVTSFSCVGTLSQSNNKRIEIFTTIDLDVKTKKGCALHKPSRRGLHCFDFTFDDNHYTLLNGYKKPEEVLDANYSSQGFFMVNIADIVINRKTTIFEAAGTLSNPANNRIVISFTHKGTCEKSSNNSLLVKNKI
jgi:hypothetical protein